MKLIIFALSAVLLLAQFSSIETKGLKKNLSTENCLDICKTSSGLCGGMKDEIMKTAYKVSISTIGNENRLQCHCGTEAKSQKAIYRNVEKKEIKLVDDNVQCSK